MKDYEAVLERPRMGQRWIAPYGMRGGMMIEYKNPKVGSSKINWTHVGFIGLVEHYTTVLQRMAIHI